MEKLLTIQEVSDILKISKHTLRQWDNKNKLPSIRTPGGHRRYLISQIESIVENTINKNIGNTNEKMDNK